MMKKNSVDSLNMNGQNLTAGYMSRDYAPVFTGHKERPSFFKNAASLVAHKTADVTQYATDMTRISFAQNPVRRVKSRKPQYVIRPFLAYLYSKIYTPHKTNRTCHSAVAVSIPIFPHKKTFYRFCPAIFSISLYAVTALLFVWCFTLVTGAIAASFTQWQLSSFADSMAFNRDTVLTGNMYGYVLPPAEYTDSDIPVGNAVLPAVTYQTYSVRSGDSISSITGRFGLRNISTLLSVNNIQNARRLKTGQKLTVPSMDGIMHIVAPGESVASIAGRYAVPETALMDVNSLESSVLVTSSRLFVPGATLNRSDLRKVLGETFVFPTTGLLTSPYGYRNDPFTGVRKFHTGIDIANARGTPIRVALDGKVSVIGKNGVYGNYVIVIHDNNYQTLYAHLDSVSVRKGMFLDAGAVLGKMGNTGYSTGTHLHFSVYKNGTLVNPFSVLDRNKLRNTP